MELAKLALDVGLFTNQPDTLLPFWQHEVGLPFDEMLPVGGGVHQLRHRIGESILKINHSRDPLPETPASGYRSLRIATAGIDSDRQLTDPDNNRVTLIPEGTDRVTQLELTVAVRSIEAHTDFYERVLGLDRLDERRFSCGESLLALETAPDQADNSDMRRQGFRYITLQVFDVVTEHARILDRGGIEGRAPVRLGEVAYISFVRDPDGNWIEISQRKSLTGSLD
jgi:catechol 2,3-dioxygenase-like lactoylglutathione lyase family enzyme